MAEVKTNCKLYDKEKKICKGLNKLYCEKEDKCSFYKPRGKENEQRTTGKQS